MAVTEYRKGKNGAINPSGNEPAATPSAKPAKPAKSGPRLPAKRWLRILRLVIAGYLLLYLLLAGWIAVSLQHVPAAMASADTPGSVWLLVGTDSRAGLSAKEQSQLHTGKDQGGQRADTIMLVHSGASGTTIVSLPRDSLVKIPAHTALDGSKVDLRKDKINAAYSYGGAKLLVATVEKATGLHIDHYMEVGFLGIRNLTDAAGGVNVCIKKAYSDKNSGLKVKKGCQTLDGKTALAYVRMRYADPTGDIGRIQRQQQFVSALLHKVARPTTLLNPIRVTRIAQAGVTSLHTGKGDGVIDTMKFAMAMRSVGNGTAKLATVPVSDPNGQSSVGSVVIWDDAAAAELFTSLGARSK